MTSIPDINLTCYIKFPCIMLSYDLSLILALIPMYTSNLQISVIPNSSCPCIPVFPDSYLCFVSGWHIALATAWGLGSEVFRHWLQLMHCTCLSKSEYFMQCWE